MNAPFANESQGHILVVEDERTTRQVLCEALSRSGYAAVGAPDGETGLDKMTAHQFDVVILDLKMPGKSGIEVLREAQEIAPDTFFIILTAHATAETAIAALRLRAYDYLQKPSSLHTLIDKVHQAMNTKRRDQQEEQAVALLRQALQTLPSPSPPQSSSRLHQPDGLLCDPAAQTITHQGQPLSLTPVEYRLLAHFIQHPDTVMSYAELAQVSHETAVPEEEARKLLRTHLYRLSRKLGTADDSPLQSVRGRGYILHGRAEL